MLVIKRLNEKVRMSDIKPGDVFLYNEGCVYMKTTNSYSEYESYDNCVNMETGELDYVEENDYVVKVQAKVIVGDQME